MAGTKQIPMTRSGAIAWARQIVSDPDVVYLDTETTGRSSLDRICSIGIVAQDGTVALDVLVNPGKPIPAGATAIHGITDEMVADAPTWEESVGAEVMKLISGRTVVIYNRGYDEPILQEHNRRLGWHEIEADWRCAMLAYSEYDGAIGNYGSLKWHKLDIAAANWGIDPGGHRAVSDAETTRRVVHAMALEGGPIAEFIPQTLEEEATTAAAIEAALPDVETTTAERPFSIDNLFILLAAETHKREAAEQRIGELRDQIQDWMTLGGLQTTESGATGATARINSVTRLKVADDKALLAWAKSETTGWQYLTEVIDKAAVKLALEKGREVPGAELVTSEQLVITPAKGDR